MGNKEDWEDVEKSVRKAEEEKLKSYKGIDITEMLKRKNIKSKNNISGEIIKFVSKRLIVIFTIISIFIIITIVWTYLDSIRNAHDIDVKQHIESFQHIKINQISANLDEGEHNRRILF